MHRLRGSWDIRAHPHHRARMSYVPLVKKLDGHYPSSRKEGGHRHVGSTDHALARGECLCLA